MTGLSIVNELLVWCRVPRLFYHLSLRLVDFILQSNAGVYVVDEFCSCDGCCE